MKSVKSKSECTLARMNAQDLYETRGGLAIFPVLIGEKLGQLINEKIRDWLDNRPA